MNNNYVKAKKSKVLHVTMSAWTLCGLSHWGSHWEKLELAGAGRAGVERLCKTCIRTAGARDIAIWNQSADETRTAKGAQIELSGAVREISAKVYRVAGQTDTYTVTVPMESGLNVTCDCRDGKIHPEKFCKHASAVLLSMQRGAA